MTFSARQYFQAGLYHVGGRFGSFGPFLNLVCSPLERAPFEVGPVLEHIENCLQPEFVSAGSTAEDRALRQLVQNDLKPLNRIFRDPAIVASIDAEENVIERMHESIQEGRKHLEALGLSFSVPDLHIVEQYPAPYTDRGGFAFNMDAGDRDTYGIKPGLYFQKSLLRPYYSKYIALHEIIHTVLGEKSPYLLARGLEEGIAEVLGSVYLTQKVMGDDLCRNLFIFNRLSVDDNPLHDLYLDYARQAFALYQLVGLKGLAAIVAKGREEVKRWETLLWIGNLAAEALSPADDDTDFSQMLMQLLLIFSRKSVGSPAAVLLSNMATDGVTFQELADQTQLDLDTVKSGLNEIRLRTRFVTFDEKNGYISFSDANRIVNPHEFRYFIPENATLF
jgi:hypothetical protein